MNTYAYVRNNPITRFDLFGLYECSCKNTSGGGGSGDYIQGRKQFSYLCFCDCLDGTRERIAVTGGGQGGDAQGQTALGSDLATGVALDGRLYTHAIGFYPFPVDTDRPWYKFWEAGEITLNANIDQEMDRRCKSCENTE